MPDQLDLLVGQQIVHGGRRGGLELPAGSAEEVQVDLDWDSSVVAGDPDASVVAAVVGGCGGDREGGLPPRPVDLPARQASAGEEDHQRCADPGDVRATPPSCELFWYDPLRV